MKTIHSLHVFSLFRVVSSAVILFMLGSCTDDLIEQRGYRDDVLHFNVSTVVVNNAATRSQEPAKQEVHPSSRHLGVYTLQGESPSDTLFMHASVTDGFTGSVIGGGEKEKTVSRGLPVNNENFDKEYGSFGLLASRYTDDWDGSACPNYIYDREVKCTVGTTATADGCYWPKGENLRFFTYAPYSLTTEKVVLASEGDTETKKELAMVLSDADSPGAPTFVYTVPQNVEEQKDLLVAVTEGGSKPAGDVAVQLDFKHALTAVRFKVKNDLKRYGKITKITLKNIYSKGTYHFDPVSVEGEENVTTHWTEVGRPVNFSMEIPEYDNPNPDAEPENPVLVTDKEFTLMMIPQVLPDDAEVEVEFTETYGEEISYDRTLSVHLQKDKDNNVRSKWEMGKAVDYILSESSVEIEGDVFDVTERLVFDYLANYVEGGEEGQAKYKVDSYRKVSTKTGRKIIPLGWEVLNIKEYRWDKYGNEIESENFKPQGSEIPLIPDLPYYDNRSWLTDFTMKGDGNKPSTLVYNPVEIRHRDSVHVNVHDDWLMKQQPISPNQGGYFDLSMRTYASPIPGITNGTRNTANCYIINQPGSYCLPLVYGNAIKNGETNWNAFYTSKPQTDYVVLGVKFSEEWYEKNGGKVPNDKKGAFVNHLNKPIKDPYIYNNDGCNVVGAKLLWQDERELITTGSVSIQDIGEEKMLVFKVQNNGMETTTFKQGNAVVAVYGGEDGNTILWSWHIWVTDFEQLATLDPDESKMYDHDVIPKDKKVHTRYGAYKRWKVHENMDFYFMGCAVGWCDEGYDNYGERKLVITFKQKLTNTEKELTLIQTPHKSYHYGNHTYYQWGRKDPMPPLFTPKDMAESVVDKITRNVGQASDYRKVTEQATIGQAIQHPDWLYTINVTHDNSWHKLVDEDKEKKKMYRNLWNTDCAIGRYDRDPESEIKTIYDPSPVGYYVPPHDAFRAFMVGQCYTPGDEQTLQNHPELFNSPYVIKNEYGKYVFERDSLLRYCGWELYCFDTEVVDKKNPAGGTIFFPTLGYRDYDNWNANIIGEGDGRIFGDGYYWTSICNGWDGSGLLEGRNSHALSFGRNRFSSWVGTQKPCCPNGVRPVREIPQERNHNL